MKPNGQIFSGKWMVTFPPDSYSNQKLLETLLDIQTWIRDKKYDRPFKYIHINSNTTGNNYSLTRDAIFIDIQNRTLSDLTENRKFPNKPFKGDLFSGRLNRIMLLYPTMLSDKRWESIQIPTPWLFLGSALVNHHFQVHIQKTVLPLSHPRQEWFSFDVLGFTLYEDLLIEFLSLLNPIKEQFQGILAAGGPMITLNPLESAYHLPGINLMVRGEAEFVFPELLQAIKSNDLDAMMRIKGFLFRKNDLLVISDFDQINHPRDFRGFHFNLDFLNTDHLKNGLEVNVSRGCSRGCIFCSRLQGKSFRKFPLEKLEQLLIQFSEKLDSAKINSHGSRTININDDDLLQDIQYAKEVFRLIKNHQFTLWGIQTSINSFFYKRKEPDIDLLNMISDRSLFVNHSPLLWLGTDAFLKIRGKRLGKMVPTKNQIKSLVLAFEKQNIQNYHYWISSDYLSSWEDFIQEFRFLMDLKMEFKTFHILAHAPFLIPYSATPLYHLLSGDPEFTNQFKYRINLKTSREPFDFIVAERVETRFPYLNRLLKNESTVQPGGFFDYLKTGDFFNALKTIYNFLKQERLSFESVQNHDRSFQLKNLEKIVENKLGKMI